MNTANLEKRSIAEQAAFWIEEIDTDGGAGTHSAAFLRWLKASPLHVHELLLAARVRNAIRQTDPRRQVDVDALIAAADTGSNVRPLDRRTPPVPRTRATRRRWLAMTAGVAATALLGWTVFALLHAGDTYSTARGEQRMVKLTDGSVVFLNTDTEIRVRYGSTVRSVRLQRGQALFQVQRDATRPFRVHSAQALIQAVGTAFDVRRDEDLTTVAVVEGAVDVSSIRLDAGEGVTVEPSGQVGRPRSVDTEAITAWRQQRLIFHDTPLAQIVREFNRYNTTPRMRVEGEALRARRFNGSFHALRPESFLAYLAQEQQLGFERRGDEAVILDHGAGR